MVSLLSHKEFKLEADGPSLESFTDLDDSSHAEQSDENLSVSLGDDVFTDG